MNYSATNLRIGMSAEGKYELRGEFYGETLRLSCHDSLDDVLIHTRGKPVTILPDVSLPTPFQVRSQWDQSTCRGGVTIIERADGTWSIISPEGEVLARGDAQRVTHPATPAPDYKDGPEHPGWTAQTMAPEVKLRERLAQEFHDGPLMAEEKMDMLSGTGKWCLEVADFFITALRGAPATVYAWLALDAARYRWLRERDVETIEKGGVFAGMTPQNVVLSFEDLDTAVDAARARSASDVRKGGT